MLKMQRRSMDPKGLPFVKSNLCLQRKVYMYVR